MWMFFFSDVLYLGGKLETNTANDSLRAGWWRGVGRKEKRERERGREETTCITITIVIF